MPIWLEHVLLNKSAGVNSWVELCPSYTILYMMDTALRVKELLCFCVNAR